MSECVSVFNAANSTPGFHSIQRTKMFMNKNILLQTVPWLYTNPNLALSIIFSRYPSNNLDCYKFYKYLLAENLEQTMKLARGPDKWVTCRLTIADGCLKQKLKLSHWCLTCITKNINRIHDHENILNPI